MTRLETITETCSCGAAFTYAGDYGGQRAAAFRAEHQVCRGASVAALTKTAAEDTSGHQPCNLGLELRTYIAALRSVVKAYEDAGRGDEACDIGDFADELEQLWSGSTPAATLVADWYGQPGASRVREPGPLTPPRRPPTPTATEDTVTQIRDTIVAVLNLWNHPEVAPRIVGIIGEPPWLDQGQRLARLGDAYEQLQVQALVGREPYDALGGHVDVRLGPGETITIMTDPARVDDLSPNGTVVLHGRLITDGSYGGPHMRLDASHAVQFRKEV